MTETVPGVTITLTPSVQVIRQTPPVIATTINLTPGISPPIIRYEYTLNNLTL